MTQLLDSLTTVVGEGGILSGNALSGRSAGFWKGGDFQALALVRPRSVDEVCAVLKLCNDAHQPVVPIGGLTGLAEAHVSGPAEIALSLERMNMIGDVDTLGRTVTVQAGAVLENVQTHVADAGLLFPLDMGARSSCSIGGNIATNAGGNRVIRYGMMRDLVLGLEAVLADGTVVSSMNGFIKNNTGYDLRQLFVGAEGTLGVVTGAVLRLYEAPVGVGTALLAVPNWEAVLALMRQCDRALGGGLVAFEVMWQNFFELNTGQYADAEAPFATKAPYYVLLEMFESDPEADTARLESLLGACIEDGMVVDGVVAKSEDERRRLWDIRESFEAEFRAFGGSIGYDISLPQRDMKDYVDTVTRAVTKRWPEAGVYAFGHVGDGNLHFSVVNVGYDPHPDIDYCVYEPLRAYGGSVSAEHGIGLEKKEFLEISRSPAEIAVMRTIKLALDPNGILNPGKVFDL